MLCCAAGDSGLRVGAAVSFMLVTRKVLPAPLISQPDILSGQYRGLGFVTLNPNPKPGSGHPQAGSSNTGREDC
jgi:hypothetical protein